MYIGEFLGNESIELEFKEFCLKYFPEDTFTQDEIHQIISGNWNPKLNSLIIKNLNIYIESYIPECVSSFINSGIDGQIYIGCNDNGEVSGIPFYGKDEKAVNKFQTAMKNKIKKELELKIYSSNDERNILIKDGIHIEIERIIIDKCLIEDEAKLFLQRYYHRKNAQKKSMDLYIFKKERWMEKVKKYSSKLEVILNTPELRYEIANFINENGIIYKNDTKRVYNVIEKLSSDKYIHPFLGLAIQEARDNELVETLEFWISYFKDTKLDRLMEVRPKRPTFQIPMSPKMVVQRLSILRKRFAEQEKNVSFFVIKVRVDGHKLKEEIKHTKYLNIDNKWTSKIRVWEKHGPCNLYKEF
jgi:hypothetical protein